jgi:cell wall-associated NlpC family hydrolase
MTHLACGIACPGDSDQQAETLGDVVAPDQPVARGDLFFWKGHVAMALDETRLIHANAFHMAVAAEKTEQAIDRIRARGDGEVIVRRRPKPL